MDCNGLRLQLLSTLHLLRLHCSFLCKFVINHDLPLLEQMEIYNRCSPILASIESFISNSKSAAGSEDFMVLYGKLPTGYHLKGYPDGILDLEINGLIHERHHHSTKKLW